MKSLRLYLSLLTLITPRTPLQAQYYHRDTDSSRDRTTTAIALAGVGIAGVILGAVGMAAYDNSAYYKAKEDENEKALLYEAEQALERMGHEAHELFTLRSISLDNLITYVSYHGNIAFLKYKEQIQVFRTLIQTHKEHLSLVTGHYTDQRQERLSHAARLLSSLNDWNQTILAHEYTLRYFEEQRNKPLYTLISIHNQLQAMGLRQTISPALAIEFAERQFAGVQTEQGLYGFPFIACTSFITSTLTKLTTAQIALSLDIYQIDTEVQKALVATHRDIQLLTSLYEALINTPYVRRDAEAHQRAEYELIQLKRQAAAAEAQLREACNRARTLDLEAQKLNLLGADIAERMTHTLALASHQPCQERERQLKKELGALRAQLLKERSSADYILLKVTNEVN